jgi:protein involved in polysaccharide export with SLBB domain
MACSTKTTVESNHTYIIHGEGIKEPGAYNFRVPSKIEALVKKAGGFTKCANRAKMRVYRIEEGREVSQKVRYGDVLKSGDKIYVSCDGII